MTQKEEKTANIGDVLEEFKTSRDGLTTQECEERLKQYGYNQLEEKKVSPIMKFLNYFWGPIPWMIEVAAILSLIVRHWADFIIITIMLLINAFIGFIEEHKADNALDALKNQLALKAKVLRDKQWQEIDARLLVPGDIVRLRLGDIIPADVILIEGDYLSVDQAALTGESLPVTKRIGDEVYSGSIVKQGEMVAVVKATGENTYFGKTAKLVESAGAISHFQKAVMQIGDFLIFTSIFLSIILATFEIARGESVLVLVEFILILIVASIPVAMPAVLSVTMAMGAFELSKKKAIVSHLQSIEEMAGIDILCSDKTGTLTKNKITLGDPVLFNQTDKDEIILVASLASKEENKDAIDSAILSSLKDRSILNNFSQEKFVPFDPISKRTEAVIKDLRNNSKFMVSKGAPQVILQLCSVDTETYSKADEIIKNLASKGYRTLGVAKKENGDWKFLGILPMYDPPREDSKETIQKAKELGISVKMITGDNIAIAKEIASQLGLGRNILPADVIFKDVDIDHLRKANINAVEKADGFAQVFPEHKYAIVKALQEKKHLVGMTGDGVNDAPALKQADVGIAVSNATDAARAAASLILTAPGLSVIIDAVKEARKIFARMMSYTIYRIAMTIDIMIFVVLAMVIFGQYPLTAVMIILLALMDDIPIMTISTDNTYLDPKPVKWEMSKVLTISTVMGLLAVAQTFVLFLAGKYYHLSTPYIQTMMFLQLVAGGHLMLFVTRTKKCFFGRPFPSWQLFTAIMLTQIAAILMAGFGFLMPAISWTTIALIWAYNIGWMIVEDIVKLGVYYYMHEDKSKRKHFAKINKSLHMHPFHRW